jgi:hypothetical protein
MPQVSDGMPAATIRLTVETLTHISSASSRASTYLSSMCGARRSPIASVFVVYPASELVQLVHRQPALEQCLLQSRVDLLPGVDRNAAERARGALHGNRSRNPSF